jgi:hypothetical protein
LLGSGSGCRSAGFTRGRLPWNRENAPPFRGVGYSGIKALEGIYGANIGLGHYHPWVLLRDPWVLPRDPWVLLRDPWVPLRDPWVLRRDPWVKPRDPWVKPRDPWVKPRDLWVKRRAAYQLGDAVEERVEIDERTARRCMDTLA